MSKIYYIGTLHGEPDENGLVAWCMEGIFDDFDNAIESMSDNEFLVELELNKKLPKEIIIPDGWWKIDGEIISTKAGEE